mmetsp:Transcript_3188/g.3344  ORF Transcript_3188/g.3344 Transcript_3188/m.3344 type:complete len:274 (-) Transcript_3188:410-1231(-)
MVIIPTNICIHRYIYVYLFISTLWGSYCVLSEDIPAIYGMLALTGSPVDDAALSLITQKCYSGMLMKTCTSVVSTDSQTYSYGTDYYNNILSNTPQLYCLQCCSSNPQRQDNWKVQCIANVFTAQATNLYRYEFRFGVSKTLGGPGYISCPLKRKACTYDTKNVLIGCAEFDSNVLHGYHITLNVIRYTSNLQSWRGISSCEAISDESSVVLEAGDIFTESMTMNWQNAPFEPNQAINKGFFAFLGIIVLYVILYFCRQKKMSYLHEKISDFP